jgi:hypothetical protein
MQFHVLRDLVPLNRNMKRNLAAKQHRKYNLTLERHPKCKTRIEPAMECSIK